MTFYNRGNDRPRGGQNYGRPSFNDRGSDRPAMFDAVCAKCGSDCQVPFKPNGRKEVFCSKCFETNGGGESRDSRGSRDFGASRSFDRRDSSSTYFADKQMFSAVCGQCGENCKVPFEPRNGKPVFCSNCFSNKTDDRDFAPKSYSKPSTGTSNLDLETVNAKLDKIIKLLTSKDSSEPKEVKVQKEVAKEITQKILSEIEANSDKKIVSPKKSRTKKVS